MGRAPSLWRRGPERQAHSSERERSAPMGRQGLTRRATACGSARLLPL